MRRIGKRLPFSMVISFASRSASRMISSKESPGPRRARGFFAAQAGKAALAASSAALASSTVASATEATLFSVAGYDHVEAGAVGGFAPLAADPQVGWDIGEKIVVHDAHPS